MEHTNLTKNLLKIKDPSIQMTEVIHLDTHSEVLALLDYTPPNCPACQGKMSKHDFQKPAKIPYLESGGYKTLIRLKKRRFQCQNCRKVLVAETSLVKKNHQIPHVINHKISQLLMEKRSLSDIAEQLAISTSTVIRQLKKCHFKTDLTSLPEVLSWDEFTFQKGKMCFVAQDYTANNIIAILNGRSQAIIRNHFLRYQRSVREKVKWITMDMFSPYYSLAKELFPNAQMVLDRFHIIQHLNRAMNRTRINIMNTMDRKSHQYRAIKRYWKLIQQDSRKLSDKRFYRPTFRMHLTNLEILEKLLSYSDELRYYYDLYQLLLFHFQEKNSQFFFELIEQEMESVNSIFRTAFQTFLRNIDKIEKALEQPYSNAKLDNQQYH